MRSCRLSVCVCVLRRRTSEFRAPPGCVRRETCVCGIESTSEVDLISPRTRATPTAYVFCWRRAVTRKRHVRTVGMHAAPASDMSTPRAFTPACQAEVADAPVLRPSCSCAPAGLARRIRETHRITFLYRTYARLTHRQKWGRVRAHWPSSPPAARRAAASRCTAARHTRRRSAVCSLCSSAARSSIEDARSITSSSRAASSRSAVDACGCCDDRGSGIEVRAFFFATSEGRAMVAVGPASSERRRLLAAPDDATNPAALRAAARWSTLLW